MSAKAVPDVKIPTDTRGDNWAYEVAQRMHDRLAAKVDRQLDADANKTVAHSERKQIAPRNTRMKIRAYRAA